MKRFTLVLLLTLAMAALAHAQQPTPSPSASPAPKPAMTKAQSQKMIIATEKKLWEAWKNKDAKPFKANLSADSVLVSEMGVVDKAAIVKQIAEDTCEVRSYTMSDFKVSFPASNAAVVAYKVTQDVTCGGQAAPPAIWASSTYVRSGNKWMAASHMETPAK